MGRTVTATAPGKFNLSLRVGERSAGGLHRVSTVYQAISLTERVDVSPAEGFTVEHEGPFVEDSLPLDETNQAIRAAHLLAERHLRVARGCHIRITKNVPVAAGLGSGPADAAAALVACAQLWGLELSRRELFALAAELSPAVPFALSGGTALGLQDGSEVTPLPCRGELHWVLALSGGELGTQQVYKRLDDLREGRSIPEPEADRGLIRSIALGDVAQIGTGLANDLEAPAKILAPHLKDVLRAGMEAGALGGVVAGSGPTVAFLASGEIHARQLAEEIGASPAVIGVLRTTGPQPGTRVMAAPGSLSDVGRS